MRRKTLFLAVGPSGAGKSTRYAEMCKTAPFDILYTSFDENRLKWYDTDDYAEAFKRALADENFIQKSHDEAEQQMVERQLPIYVDNTNLNVSDRAAWIAMAKRNGYHVVALLFRINIKELMERQKTRTDKTIPEEVVIKHATKAAAITVKQLKEEGISSVHRISSEPISIKWPSKCKKAT